MTDKKRKAALKALREGFSISGDGVARRDMEKAFQSPSFRKSAKDLIEANLIEKAKAT